MGRWLAVLGFLFLAACQQPQAGGTAQPTASSVDRGNDDLPEDWSSAGVAEKSYFEPEQRDLGKKLAAALFGVCYRHAGDKAELDNCLRRGLIDTFDDSGEGRRHCKSAATIDAFTDCIVVGNAAVQLLKRMDSKTEIDAATWTGRRGFADAMGKVIVTKAIMACGDAQTEESAERCVLDWYRKTLAVPEALAKVCGPDLGKRERVTCLSEASLVDFIQVHVARMPGVGI